MAVIVDKLVTNRPPQPSAQVVNGGQGVEVFGGFEEDFLQEVFGLFGIVDSPADEGQ